MSAVVVMMVVITILAIGVATSAARRRNASSRPGVLAALSVIGVGFTWLALHLMAESRARTAVVLTFMAATVLVLALDILDSIRAAPRHRNGTNQ